MAHAVHIAVLVLAAAVTGVCATLIHPVTVTAGLVTLPFGLVLALLGVAALGTLAHMSARSRVGVATVAGGWLVPMVALSQSRPGGDIVVAENPPGLVFLVGSVVILGVTVGLPASGGDSQGTKRG